MSSLVKQLRLPLALCFGTRTLKLHEILELSLGDVFSLDTGINQPVTLLAGEHPVALGEIIAVDGNYALRILSLTSDNAILPSQS